MHEDVQRVQLRRDVIAKAAELDLPGDAECLGASLELRGVVLFTEEWAADDPAVDVRPAEGQGERIQEDVLSLPAGETSHDTDREPVPRSVVSLKGGDSVEDDMTEHDTVSV